MVLNKNNKKTKQVNNLWPRDARLCFMRDTDTDLDLEAIKNSTAACYNFTFTYKTFLHALEMV